MSWNPNLIYYACIAKDITILAEYNSKDADLRDLAKKCLERTPPYHSFFSYTVHGRTYMFFILDPFVYFGIFHESLDNAQCLAFLKSIKDAFTSMIDDCSSAMLKQRLHSPNSHCFQGEFSPVFHQLLGFSSEFDMTLLPVGLRDDLCSVKNKGLTPLLRDFSLEGLKMKKRFFGEASKGGLEDQQLDVLSDDDLTVSSRSRLQKAKYIWKKHVMLVLSMDLVVCAGLFVIWLWVCSGFQCVANST